MIDIPNIIKELESILDSENKKEKLQSLLTKVRTSPLILNYNYSFIVDAIKTMINTLDNEDCNIKREDIYDVIYRPIKILHHINKS